eukprot:scaffold18267_cov146-Isochrysis_galbana.AAC.1
MIQSLFVDARGNHSLDLHAEERAPLPNRLLGFVAKIGLGHRPPALLPETREHSPLNALVHQGPHDSVSGVVAAYGPSAPGMQTQDAGRADPPQDREGRARATAADTPWAELRHNVHQVAVWWAIWSLYDHFLSPYSPVAEAVILCLSVAYCMSGDMWQQRLQPPSSGTNATAERKVAAEAETVSA